jgi:hypothetical protein
MQSRKLGQTQLGTQALSRSHSADKVKVSVIFGKNNSTDHGICHSERVRFALPAQITNASKTFDSDGCRCGEIAGAKDLKLDQC